MGSVFLFVYIKYNIYSNVHRTANVIGFPTNSSFNLPAIYIDFLYE